jgi:hypothetical protein
MSAEEPPELRNAAWWAEKKFQEQVWLARRRQQDLDSAAMSEDRRAKDYAETIANVKEAKKVLQPAVPEAVRQAVPPNATAKATTSAAPAEAGAPRWMIGKAGQWSARATWATCPPSTEAPCVVPPMTGGSHVALRK